MNLCLVESRWISPLKYDKAGNIWSVNSSNSELKMEEGDWVERPLLLRGALDGPVPPQQVTVFLLLSVRAEPRVLLPLSSVALPLPSSTAPPLSSAIL